MGMFSRDRELLERLDKLERRADELEHAAKMMRLEWEETYEKIANNLRKLGRRAEVLQKEMDGGKPPLSESEQALLADQGDRSEPPKGLTPRQQMVRDQVLRRRRGVM